MVYPREVWFLDKLLIQLGENRLERYSWSKILNEELQEIIVTFIKKERIRFQRAYKRRTVGNKDIPSLDTLKKRFDDINIKPFF